MWKFLLSAIAVVVLDVLIAVDAKFTRSSKSDGIIANEKMVDSTKDEQNLEDGHRVQLQVDANADINPMKDAGTHSANMIETGASAAKEPSSGNSGGEELSAFDLVRRAHAEIIQGRSYLSGISALTPAASTDAAGATLSEKDDHADVSKPAMWSMAAMSPADISFIVIVMVVVLTVVVYCFNLNTAPRDVVWLGSREFDQSTSPLRSMREALKNSDASSEDDDGGETTSSEHKAAVGMQEGATRCGMLWRLSLPDASNFVTEDFEQLIAFHSLNKSPKSNSRSSSQPSNFLLSASDMKFWWMRYSNLKVIKQLLTIGWLADKDDIEPVMMQLQPFKNGRSTYAMQIGQIKTNAEADTKDERIASMQKYQAALGIDDAVVDLPKVLHLFIVCGKKYQDVEYTSSSDPSCRIDDAGQHVVFAVESAREAEEWVAHIQTSAKFLAWSPTGDR